MHKVERIFCNAALIVIAGLAAHGCGGCEGDNNPAKTREISVIAANLSGVASVDVEAADQAKAVGLSFADNSHAQTVTTGFPIKLEVFRHGEAAPVWTGTRPGIGSGIAFVLGPAASPFAVYASGLNSLDADNTLLYFVLGDWEDAASYDVYIFRSDRPLAGEIPDASDLRFDATGGTTLTAWDSVTPGIEYRVVLCTPGTKTIVRDLGVVGEAGAPIVHASVYFMFTSRLGSGPTTQLLALPRP